MKHSESTDAREQTRDQIVESSRRRLLQGLGLLGSAALFSTPSMAETSCPSNQQPITVTQSSPDLERFVDELPRPNVLKPIGRKKGKPVYEVEMREVEQQLHRDLPKTTVWGYEGQYPGPTIEAKRGEDVYVTWKNKLPTEHLLPVDTTIHGAGPENPEVRTTTHLHGANVEPESDGHPEAWFTRDFEERGPFFEKKTYWYANEQPATSLWYHDHALGITRLNVYAGLAGFYFLRGKHERKFDLPKDDYEIPLLFQDRTFNEDGSLFYPEGPDGAANDLPSPSILPEFFGDTSVVNGKAWPRLTVDPRKYRFRMLDGANSRFYNIGLFQYDESTGEITGDGPPIIQIGSDGGFLEQPVTIEERLLLGPGMRADTIVDFSEYEGQMLLVHNNAPTPFTGAFDTEDAQPLPEVMLIEVTEQTKDGHDRSRIPTKLKQVPDLEQCKINQERDLTLAEGQDEFNRLKLLLGTEESPNGLDWDAPITENPTVGNTEIWNLVNLTVDTHPIHLHLVQFQVIGRRPFDVDTYLQDAAADGNEVQTIENYYTGESQPPEENEEGWKDTVSANPDEVTRVIAHFGEFDGLFKDFTGEYPWHCHILEHEDHEMMRPYEVLPRDGDDEKKDEDGHHTTKKNDTGGKDED